MKIKMIATDIDGTLVTDDKQIMPRTVAALKEARKRGIYVVLCSGRPVSGIQDYLAELGLTGNDDYAITFNKFTLRIKTSASIRLKMPFILTCH